MVPTTEFTRLVALTSDFEDYYDQWFDAPRMIHPDYVYQRFTHMGPQRPTMFRLFRQLGLQTPVHGPARFVGTSFACYNRQLDDRKVVVYLDNQRHLGDSKLLMTLAQAVKDYPDRFISEYIEPGGVPSTSLRYLRVGRRQFWLQYTSFDDWRSNVGDVQVQVLREDEPLPMDAVTSGVLRYPMFSIDFVQGRYLYAIDLNLSPRIAGTGVELLIDGKSVVRELKTVLHAQQSHVQAQIAEAAELADMDKSHSEPEQPLMTQQNIGQGVSEA